MAYRNKTFVSFASEHIHAYRLMCAWRSNAKIDFNFYDAHDLNIARDTSTPETIKRRLRERLRNAKQVVMLLGDCTRRKASQASSFIYYEVVVISELKLPVVFVNLNNSRRSQKARMPVRLHDHYTVSVSFKPGIIKYALDEYPPKFNSSRRKLTAGPYHYKAESYRRLGLG